MKLSYLSSPFAFIGETFHANGGTVTILNYFPKADLYLVRHHCERDYRYTMFGPTCRNFILKPKFSAGQAVTVTLRTGRTHMFKPATGKIFYGVITGAIENNYTVTFDSFQENINSPLVKLDGMLVSLDTAEIESGWI